MDGELKNLPLIVYPHGGPQSRDWLAFDPLAQYWASQGYLVFQPNFRGSTGYGKAFEEAGYQQYGGRILDDIESGIRALIKAGYADPDRICVAGMSFGGYAAVAMAAFKPGLVKCAISINGLHDLPFRITNKLKDVKDRELRFDVRDFFDRTVGNIDTQRDLLERHSTVLHAASVNVPILLIHADDDENVEVEHSIRMEAALKKAGKDVQLIRLPKGGHSLKTGGALRTTILESMQFFRAHL